MDTIKVGSLSPVRVRFAPSPTGFLHIGNFRAALFNFLFARHHNGFFLLRIEDTDRQRFKQEYIEAILSALEWVGMDFDEPLVVQSERIEEHKQIADRLVKEGKAYRCYCAQDEVIARHQQKYPGDMFIKYDGLCRALKEQDHDASKPYVIRFALPTTVFGLENQEIVFDDLIRGRVAVSLDQLDDFIIVRSDGGPMYNFVVVIDDAFMRITHVIRGEDHISNTPKQILLAQACGYPIPQFAHLPLILGPSGEKLSKREAAVSVAEYQQEGYLPDALMNYLARLGWAHGDQEIFSKKELIQYFDLNQVSKKGAIFDIEKFKWVNAVHIRQAAAVDLLAYMITNVNKDVRTHLSGWDLEVIERVIDLYKERVHTLQELQAELMSVYVGPSMFNQDDIINWTNTQTPAYLDVLCKELDESEDFSLDAVKNIIKELAKKMGVKMVVIAQPVRIALLGSSNGPGVFDLLSILGKKEGVRRICALRDAIVL